MLIIEQDLCSACKLCIKNCPFGALYFENDQLQVTDLCTLCGACVNICRKNALQIERKKASPEELAKHRGVYVWVELEDVDSLLRPRKVAYELLGKGRYLADRLGQELVAVVLGDEKLGDLEELGHYGADRIILCQAQSS